MSIEKKIASFSDYVITKAGEVISYRTSDEGKILKPSISTGYAKVTLVSKKGISSNKQVHRLVAEAFLPKPKDRKANIVNHKDGDKLNNAVSNLEWTTRQGNAIHYEKELAPKYKADRKEKKQNDIMTRLSIISHAQTACTGNPELFQSIVATALDGIKI